MSIVPAATHDWAARRGISAFHPGEWTAEDHAAFVAWKLDLLAETWAFYRSLGLEPDADRLLADTDAAHAKPPTDLYQVCPCHPTRPDSYRETGQIKAPLRWLRETFGAKG